MLKLTKIFLLLLVSANFAQGPLLTLMDDGISYEPETLTYLARVEADGGEIINIDLLNSAIINAKTNNYLDSLGLWVCPQFGVKKDANNKVTKLYDVTGNNNDLVASDTASSGTLLSDSLWMNGEARYYEFTDISTIRTVFEVLTDRQYDGSQRRFILGDNDTYDFYRGGNGVGGDASFTHYWDSPFASANIRSGITRCNGVVIADPINAEGYMKHDKSLTTVLTTGNVEAGNFSKDRTSAVYWLGSLYELIISSVGLSAEKVGIIETTLNARHTIY